jgi:hypothetical protein
MMVFIGSLASNAASMAVIHSLSLGMVMGTSAGDGSISAVTGNRFL